MWSVKQSFSICSGIFPNLYIFKNALRLHTTPVLGQLVYAVESLGLDGYISKRTTIQNQFRNNAAAYREKMSKFLQTDPNAMVFTDDLKNMTYLCEKSDTDLIRQMIQKYNDQNREMRFGNFIFGPVVMRMYFHLDLPDEALEVFNENKNSIFFDQVSSCMLLMSLLYKHQKYDEIYKVFDYVQERQSKMTKFPKTCVNIFMSACYKENSKESFDRATKLWSEFSAMGVSPARKTVYYFAGLALNQSAPHVAMEALSVLASHKHIVSMNLKAMTLIELNRLDDAIPILRSLVDIDQPMLRELSSKITKEVIDKMEQKIDEKYANKILKSEFTQIHKALMDRKLITNNTIDSLICQEIVKRDDMNNNNAGISLNFRNKKPYNQRVPQKSLSGMY